jgi:hypothetical protein
MWRSLLALFRRLLAPPLPKLPCPRCPYARPNPLGFRGEHDGR